MVYVKWWSLRKIIIFKLFSLRTGYQFVPDSFFLNFFLSSAFGSGICVCFCLIWWICCCLEQQRFIFVLTVERIGCLMNCLACFLMRRHLKFVRGEFEYIEWVMWLMSSVVAYWFNLMCFFNEFCGSLLSTKEILLAFEVFREEQLFFVVYLLQKKFYSFVFSFVCFQCVKSVFDSIVFSIFFYVCLCCCCLNHLAKSFSS